MLCLDLDWKFVIIQKTLLFNVALSFYKTFQLFKSYLLDNTTLIEQQPILNYEFELWFEYYRSRLQENTFQALSKLFGINKRNQFLKIIQNNKILFYCFINTFYEMESDKSAYSFVINLVFRSLMFFITQKGYYSQISTFSYTIYCTTLCRTAETENKYIISISSFSTVLIAWKSHVGTIIALSLVERIKAKKNVGKSKQEEPQRKYAKII